MKLIKIPFSNGGLKKTKGCELAPEEIIKDLDKFFLNEAGFKPQFTIDEVKIDQHNIEETNKNVFEKIKTVTSKAIILGGDHSITYASFKAAASKNPDMGLVIFDAHPDCESDINPPTHEDFLRSLITEKILDPNKVIIIGLRNWDGPEKEFLELNKIRFFNMKQINLTGITEVIDTITETIRSWSSFYISIDIDVVDPAFAPGTGYIEPGGLSSRDIIYFIQRLKILKNWQLADIVEVNPTKDQNRLTSNLAAKLIVELC